MGIYWLASYPKSGNTWFRAFLRNYQEGKPIPLDIDELGLGGLAASRGWLDEVLGFDTAELSEAEVEELRPAVYRWEGLSIAAASYHKVHDAFVKLPSGEPLFPAEGMLGAIYLLRNPLDVAVSFSHYYGCSVDKAIEQMGHDLYLAPTSDRWLIHHVRQRLLNWSQHVCSWLDAPGLRVEAIRYEDMKHAPLETFTRAVRFLGLPEDEAHIARAVRHSGFGELKAQEQAKGFKSRPQGVKHFFRKGITGDWKNVLSEAQVNRIIADHGEVMRRFGYLDAQGRTVDFDG